MSRSHEPYYTDRRTEYELCCAFPAAEPLIGGLHALQMHLRGCGVRMDIPVMRVMNTAHFMAAYMFNSPGCDSQQLYDAMIYDSMGHDPQTSMIALIVLAAMLDRTDGRQAHTLRNIVIDDRGEEFMAGLSLYEQYLESSELRFSDEDFLTDMMAQIATLTREKEVLREQLTKQQTENEEMKKEVHIGYNVEKMIIKMQGGTLVQHADVVQAAGDVRVESASHVPQQQSPETIAPLSAKHRGPKVQCLFADGNGQEDTERTRSEAERMKAFIAAHHMGNMRLDSTSKNRLNLLVACFYYEWRNRSWVNDEPQGQAIARFVIEQCNIPCDVTSKSFAKTIAELIRDGHKDYEILEQLGAYFQ